MLSYPVHINMMVVYYMVTKWTARWLKEEQRKKLQALCGKTGTPVAGLIRRGIDKYLQEKAKELKQAGRHGVISTATPLTKQPSSEAAWLHRFYQRFARSYSSSSSFSQSQQESSASSSSSARSGGTGTEFDCAACGHHFKQGDGGETDGMCEPCFDAELRKAHEQASKNNKR